ncbi:hypothetical protein R5W24_003884 [Gemmata sp. JC717]|uniref:hypothetical protein n=1 Tax=Gemmata algarum TaxID=2975278 RepID=UPI0021BB0CF1|nr:hypothetical protein [Gemmata algarum]MDY3554755.1 hypothetical protein [Gemmata algarum]
MRSTLVVCRVLALAGIGMSFVPAATAADEKHVARGKVIYATGDAVEVNFGIDAGIAPGTVFEVVRTDGAGSVTLLGTVEITRAYPKSAIANFKPKRGVPVAKLDRQELPRQDDVIRPVSRRD